VTTADNKDAAKRVVLTLLLKKDQGYSPWSFSMQTLFAPELLV
jgi:hypothetical protein